MLSQLIAPGKVLMTAHGRNRQKKQVIRSSKRPGVSCDTRLPIVLLVNNFTASSAEIFASALQDNKRAVLVGTRTFGKGTLLHVVRLANGGALRYASGRYITPSGKFIEGKGLQPDHKVVIPLQQQHRLTLQQRKFPGVVAPEIKDAVRDTQLEKALQILEQEKKSSTDESPAN
jgi:carboxyl-terminal processing protease